MDTPLLQAAQALAFAHQSQCDSSHDQFHLIRVLALSTLLANSFPQPHQPDLLVVRLSALFHDLLDAKYLPESLKGVSAQDHLASFWDRRTEDEVSVPQRRLVEKVISNVSYSKEMKRIRLGEQTEWHASCIELHCVQDADKLDAIGAFGILRCAAYSGSVSSNPLTPSPLSTPPFWPTSTPSTAMDHFDQKLFTLEGMMKTPKGKQMARRRTEFMQLFVEEVDNEWAEISDYVQV